jgi:hypothetical protein
MKNAERLPITGKTTALASFVIATSLFSFYLYFGQPYQMEQIGILVIILALIINSLLFVATLIASVLYKDYSFELLKTCGIMLFNAPVTIGYLYLVLTINFPSNF